MDRAHRLGQTKQVTVYRLITAGTIDERIVQLARNKKNVQDAVVGSSTQNAPSEAKTNDVVSLLLDDEEMQEQVRQAQLKRQRAEEKQIADGKKGVQVRAENKRQRDLAAQQAAAEAAKFAQDEDDEDAFGFFVSSLLFLCMTLLMSFFGRPPKRHSRLAETRLTMRRYRQLNRPNLPLLQNLHLRSARLHLQRRLQRRLQQTALYHLKRLRQKPNPDPHWTLMAIPSLSVYADQKRSLKL